VILGGRGCERERAVHELEGLGEVTVLGRDHAEQKERVGVAGLGRENLEAEGVREAEVAPS